MSIHELGSESTRKDITKEIYESIPTRDRQIIVLAAMYFWMKYQRQNEQQDNYSPPTPSFNDTNPEFIQIIREGLKLHRNRHGDIEGDPVSGYAEIIKDHPQRAELFGLLSDTQIRAVCRSLDAMFENQEFCATCEGWSLWDDQSPTEFTLNTTPYILWLETSNQLPWFRKIPMHTIRRAIVEGVLHHAIQPNPQSKESENTPFLPQLPDSL